MPEKKKLHLILLSLWVFTFSLGKLTPAYAYCEEYIKDDVDRFELTRICASSMGKPFYRISQHIFEEGSSLIFSFAPRSRKVLCHHYELNDEVFKNCTNYGVDFFPKTFEGKKFKVSMINILETEFGKLKKLYMRDSVFRYPEIAEMISIDNCFALVAEDNNIYLGYSERSIIDLSQCLIEFETFVSSNTSILR